LDRSGTSDLSIVPRLLRSNVVSVDDPSVLVDRRRAVAASASLMSIPGVCRKTGMLLGTAERPRSGAASAPTPDGGCSESEFARLRSVESGSTTPHAKRDPNG